MDPVSWRDDPSKLSVVLAVARRMVPYLIEATVIPTGIFYLILLTLGLWSAIVATLGYAYASVGRRILGHKAVPGLLVLATLGISVRATIYLFNDNAFVYFAQPILRTVATGAAAVSAWVITCSGVVRTVSDSVRTARREGLATAVGSNGTLRAYIAVPV